LSAEGREFNRAGVVLYTDGASRGNPGPAGIGVVARIGDREIFTISRYIGVATNNMAEYSAVIAGLEKAGNLGIEEITVMMDSELVVQQLNGGYKVRNAKLKEMYSRAKRATEALGKCRFVHVPREQNTAADRLANRALDKVLKKAKGEAGASY
jgi:ribonuclease HI